MVAGARVDVDGRKVNPLDFALWKASKEGEPWWESPWGKGRPGWHIECSVMSQKLLGETFDIHGGGEDLIFPHHDNEIAQSEGTSGKPLARIWMHNGFVRINSEKMSKSLGNVFSIREILEIWHPEVLRLFILQSHYKNPIDYSNESLAEARAGMERFYAMLKRVDEIFPELKIRPAERGTQADAAAALTGKEREIYDRIMELPEKFAEAMDDDFNTAKALGHIFDLVRLVNGYIAEEGFRATPRAALILRAVKDRMFETGNVLGLFGEDPDRYFIMDRDREALKLGLNVEEIETMIAERSRARTSRDWEKADEIRNALFQKKVFLQDSPTGTTWRIE
jgi:cysteinyl-tRNA synthetase